MASRPPVAECTNGMPILILIPIPATSHQAFPMFEKLAWFGAPQRNRQRLLRTPVTLRPASSPAGAVWGRGRDTSSAKPTLRVTRGEEIRNLWEHVTMGDLAWFSGTRPASRCEAIWLLGQSIAGPQWNWPETSSGPPGTFRYLPCDDAASRWSWALLGGRLCGETGIRHGALLRRL